jgi:hypothetical protein
VTPQTNKKVSIVEPSQQTYFTPDPAPLPVEEEIPAQVEQHATIQPEV